MEDFECHKHSMRARYAFETPWPRHKSRSPNPNHLRFDFGWKTMHHYYSFPEDGSPPRPVHTVTDPWDAVSYDIDRRGFATDDEYSRRAVIRLLQHSKSWEDENLVNWIVWRARQILAANEWCGGVVLRMIAQRVHACYESVLVRGVLGRSFEEANVGMRPASQWAIDSLERVCFGEDEEEEQDYGGGGKFQCSVCMEDEDLRWACREKGVLKMPCSHLFHGDCIIPWLNNSHYCPLCRFEMPVQNIYYTHNLQYHH
ncbi:unnamed protein product [Cuscuta europaea]|uniref:RING-type E3 ubiquitin transferase n=1 Tax=Cuscuta europaea TaxID=41803 RepID=A0A9P1EBM7_CUSEU|nr:unnamed protein product [Cuscuta europaea]